jgi:hypothetical protein
LVLQFDAKDDQRKHSPIPSNKVYVRYVTKVGLALYKFSNMGIIPVQPADWQAYSKQEVQWNQDRFDTID